MELVIGRKGEFWDEIKEKNKTQETSLQIWFRSFENKREDEREDEYTMRFFIYVCARAHLKLNRLRIIPC